MFRRKFSFEFLILSTDEISKICRILTRLRIEFSIFSESSPVRAPCSVFTDRICVSKNTGVAKVQTSFGIRIIQREALQSFSPQFQLEKDIIFLQFGFSLASEFTF